MNLAAIDVGRSATLIGLIAVAALLVAIVIRIYLK